ncbi:hypothetical protein Tco_0769294 [Tanacetum coccineum]|uniref:Uncharacterized protein n=1 Tax=Tanacetum coccineum TaxID=301880 RepID=A0ABQ4ZCJ6_9ASTR
MLLARCPELIDTGAIHEAQGPEMLVSEAIVVQLHQKPTVNGSIIRNILSFLVLPEGCDPLKHEYKVLLPVECNTLLVETRLKLKLNCVSMDGAALIVDLEDNFAFLHVRSISPKELNASSWALPGKTYSSSSNNSFGLVPIASPTLSLFHDNPYMKVMHAFYAKESPILPPTIVPPSLMLSPMFNPQEFFLPEELLPLKKRGRDRSSSSTSALPQEFEI